MDEWYVYAYFDFDLTPLYIGIGKQKSRFESHMKESTNRHLHRKIKQLQSNGQVMPHRKLWTGLTKEVAAQFERQMIALFGREDLGQGSLWNHTDGGEGVSNPSDSTRFKIGAARRGVKLPLAQRLAVGNWFRGKPIPDERKKRIGDALRGLARPKAVCDKISKTKKGRPLSAVALAASAARVGSKRTPEQRQRMSASRLVWYAVRRAENAGAQ